MEDIIDHIDDGIHECLGRGQFYGLCRLLIDDQGDVYPATYPDQSGSPPTLRVTKVTPDDRYPILIYHRLLDGALTDSEAFSFGRTMSVENRQSVRMVVLVEFAQGETVIDQIISALPDEITNVDYKSIVVGSDITLIRDRDSIWTTEWGNAYKDKYQMRYNVYALEYSINYISCNACVA